MCYRLVCRIDEQDPALVVLGRRSFGGFNVMAEAAYDACIKEIGSGARFILENAESDSGVSDTEMADRCNEITLFDFYACCCVQRGSGKQSNFAGMWVVRTRKGCKLLIYTPGLECMRVCTNHVWIWNFFMDRIVLSHWRLVILNV